MSSYPATVLHCTRLVAAVCFISFFWSGLVYSQDIPPPLTPGGARPQVDREEIPQAAPALIDVPPVIDRPLDVEEGPRIKVQSFDLQLGGSISSVISDELVQLANLALRTKISTQPPEGLTIGQMEQAASAVTDILRGGGLVLAWAYLPAQSIDDGIVIVEVLPGSLAAVEVEGNKRYKTDRLKASFQDLLGKPIRLKETETAILFVRDYPGVSPTAVLSQGSKPGTTNLTMRVIEDPVTGGVSYDNYGSELNGKQRLYGYLDWNNPLGYGDRLSLNVLQTLDPADNTYGGFKYDAPVNYRSTISLYANTNDFDVAATESQVGNDVSGKSYVAGVSVLFKMNRGRFFNSSLRAAIDVKKAEQEVNKDLTGEDKLSNIVLGVDVDGVDSLFGSALGINQGSIVLTHGKADFLGSMDPTGSSELNNSEPPSTRQLDNNDYVGADFDKLIFSYQRLQQITENNSLLIRGQYQWTDDALVSLEQFVLGGPYNIRAFPTSTELMDRGGYASAEWILDFDGVINLDTENWGINLFLFYDYGGGRLVDDTSISTPKSVDLAGWGGGLEVEFTPDFGRFTFRLEAADPTTTNFSDTTNDAITNGGPIDFEETQVWGRIGFQFN